MGPLVIFDPGWDLNPSWSPDGQSIYYTSAANSSIYQKAADGTGSEHLIHEGWAPRLSPDGRWLVFEDDIPPALNDVLAMALPADTSTAPTNLVATAANERSPMISPDGKYLAYVSSESGRDEIYLTKFPEAQGKWQVSVEGGTRPRWDQAGGKLYFTSPTAVMEVEVATGPTPTLGNPRQLFTFEQAHVLMGRTGSFDPERGGKRFVMSYNASGPVHPKLRIAVVENWASEFKTASATK